MVPRSVTTPLTAPPVVSIPRAAQAWCTVPPRAITARATAGTARPGSAMPSICECTPPFQTCFVNWPLSVASWLLSIRVFTPIERAYSPQRAQVSISDSSLLT